MLTFTDDAVKRQIEADTGIRPPFALEAFQGPEAGCAPVDRPDQASPFLPRKSGVRGLIYDVRTGRLSEVNAA